MKKFSIYLLLTLPLGLIACLEDSRLIDATGVFEATEIIVSAESGGRVLSLDISEGDELKKATAVGQIDSTQLHLSKLQLQASKIAVLSGRPDIHSQVEATEREIAKWEREKKRVENLLAGDVATQKQLDDINAQLAILESKLNAQKSSLSTNVSSIDAQSETIEIQIQQLNDQLGRMIF